MTPSAPPLEIFRKFIRFGTVTHPLYCLWWCRGGWEQEHQHPSKDKRINNWIFQQRKICIKPTFPTKYFPSSVFDIQYLVWKTFRPLPHFFPSLRSPLGAVKPGPLTFPRDRTDLDTTACPPPSPPPPSKNVSRPWNSTWYHCLFSYLSTVTSFFLQMSYGT